MLEYRFNINNGETISLGILQQTHTVDEDNNIISTSNQRWVVYPLGANPTDSQEVQDKMDEVFTDEVKARYQEYLESQKPTDEELMEQERLVKLQEAQNYLNNTDWYIVRFVDEGTEIPEDIKVKRAEARDFIRHNTISEVI